MSYDPGYNSGKYHAPEPTAASPSYPATPVDCLLSDLISIAEQSDDEAMYEDFVERLKQWFLEKEQFLAD